MKTWKEHNRLFWDVSKCFLVFRAIVTNKRSLALISSKQYEILIVMQFHIPRQQTGITCN